MEPLTVVKDDVTGSVFRSPVVKLTRDRKSET